jgi:hypothetical protein
MYTISLETHCQEVAPQARGENNPQTDVTKTITLLQIVPLHSMLIRLINVKMIETDALLRKLGHAELKTSQAFCELPRSCLLSCTIDWNDVSL